MKMLLNCFVDMVNSQQILSNAQKPLFSDMINKGCAILTWTYNGLTKFKNKKDIITVDVKPNFADIQ